MFAPPIISRAFGSHPSVVAAPFRSTSALAPKFQRSMSTKTRKEFLCIIPDRPNAIDIRKKLKSAHYEGVKPLVASGRLVVGGAMFEKHPIDGEPALFKGSMIVYAAANIDEVRNMINRDAYATSGVWDVDSMQIIPYVSAVRELMK